MKTCRIYMLLTLSFIPGLFACQKDIPDMVNNGNGLGNFHAKIDGTDWIATGEKKASINSGIIVITGVGNHKNLTITLRGTSTGTYRLHDTTMNYAVYIDSLLPSTNPYTTQGASAGAGGQVIITKIDNAAKTISGTFQFKVFRPADSSKFTFSEGSFQDIPLSIAVAPPPAGIADTLKAKIDGNNFTASTTTAVKLGNTITIMGIGTNMSTVSLSMPDTIVAGTYVIGPIGAAAVNGTYTQGSTNVFLSLLGSLTILQHDTASKRLRGNFNFTTTPLTGTTSAILTQGYFAVTHN